MTRRPIAAVLCSATLSLSLLSPATGAAAATPAPDPAATIRAKHQAATGARHEADRLKALAADQRREVATARAQIDRLVGVVARARAAQATAERQEQQALAAAAEQEAGVDRASHRLSEQHDRLGSWAADAYRSGISDPSLRDVEAVMSADDMGQALTRITMLRTVAEAQDHAVDVARTQETDQRRAAAAAARSRAQASAAAERAAQAAITVANSLAAQQARTQRLVDLLHQAQTRAAAADRTAWARQEAARAAASRTFARADTNATGDGLDGRPNRASGPIGQCQGGDTWSFSNGQIPQENLCPLWAAPGHRLRADAAHGFDRMNEAYLATFGSPICITDSYRPYAVQVQLKTTKPHLAATPGRSNHGWGIAVDLCGGINRFGTAQHTWMVQHAGQFGWYLPTWAQQNGSKPEAWHWQFRW